MIIVDAVEECISRPIEDSGIGVATEGKLEPSLVGFQRTQRRPS
jgi:hypothetical protein